MHSKLFRVQFVAMLIMSAVIGCAGSASKKAGAIRVNTLRQVKIVNDGVAAADARIGAADEAVLIASTQPGNPATTIEQLSFAHNQLTGAHKALAPVLPATKQISKGVNDAAQLTDQVQTKLDKEEASFWSHRQKVLFGTLLGLLFVIGLAAMVLEYFGKTTGLGPILQIIGDAIMSAFLWACEALYHVFTLGLAFVGRYFGSKAATQKATTEKAPAATPTPPTT